MSYKPSGPEVNAVTGSKGSEDAFNDHHCPLYKEDLKLSLRTLKFYL